MSIVYEWRGGFTNAEVNGLDADGFEHRRSDDDWQALVDRHSLGWVTARQDDELVGFASA